MKIVNEHNIDFEKVAEGLGLPFDDVIKFFNDGRIIGRLGEFIESVRFKSDRPSENSPYDVIDESNKKIEVRCVTDKLSFASSKEIGFGRQVTEQGFNDKLNNVDYFHVVDKRNINKLVIIQVTKDDINEMVKNNLIGKNKSISEKKFFNEFNRKK